MRGTKFDAIVNLILHHSVCLTNRHREVISRQIGVSQMVTVSSNSGRRLLSFSAENGFKILNTFYEHKEIHKYTWKCPGRGLKLIIDYFLVRNGMKRT